MEQIVVAYDDSPAARAALAWAIEYANDRDARILLVYVVTSIGEWELAAIQVDPDPVRSAFKQLLATDWSSPLREARISYEPILLVGRPAEMIMRCAREHDASMIVLGMTGRGILHELVSESTGRHVLQEAKRPVVAVPEMWTLPDGDTS
jgi:nucleotide-binding universal stress UspA family protein